MLRVLIPATLATACVVGSTPSDDTVIDPEPTTDETGCFSQSTLALGEAWVLTWSSALGDATYDIAVSGGDVILMAGAWDPTVFRGAGGELLSVDAGPTTDRTILARLSQDGALVWSRDLPSRRVAVEPRLAVGSDGSIYAVGLFEGAFDFGGGSRTPASPVDTYVAKYTADGALVWATTWPAKPSSQGTWHDPYVALAADGSLFVVGRSGFPELRKIGADGSLGAIVASTNEHVTAVALDATGALAVSYRKQNAETGIARYDANLAALGEQPYAEPTWVYAMTPDPDGSMLVAGTISGANQDAAVARYAADGTRIWQQSWGGPGNDRAYTLARRADGTITVAGSFYRTVDFDASAASDVRTSRSQDAMLVEYAADGAYRGARTWGGISGDRVLALATTDDGRVFASGTYASDVNFGTETVDVRENSAHDDGFLLALAPIAAAPAAHPTCAPAPVEEKTSAKLAGTSLPKTYSECVALDSDNVLYTEEGYGTCWFYVSQTENPAQFDECVAVGGGVAVPLLPGGATCDIVYDEVNGPCFGNFCD